MLTRLGRITVALTLAAGATGALINGVAAQSLGK